MKRHTVALLIVFAVIVTAMSGCKKPSDDIDVIPDETLPDISDYLLKYPDYIPEYYDDESNRQPYSYSAGRDDNGYWVGVTALDYVEMFEYKGMELPFYVHTVTDMDIDIAILGLLENVHDVDFYTLTDSQVSEHFSQTHGWNTISEMREDLEGEVLHSGVTEWFLDYIENDVVVKPPEYFLEKIELSMIEFRRQEASESGMKFSEYVVDFFRIENGIRGLVESSRNDNIRNANVQLVFQAIAEDMKLIISDKQFDDFVKRTKITNLDDAIEAVGLPYLKQRAMTMAVIDYIIENAVLLESEE